MHELKQQKKLIATILVVVITLSVITFRHKPNIVYDHNQHLVDVQKEQQEAYEQALKEYNDYLASIDANPDASKAIMQDLITPEMVNKRVAGVLNTSQSIAAPKIGNDKIVTTKDTSKGAVQEYFAKWKDALNRFNVASAPVINEAYTKQEGSPLTSMHEAASNLVKELYALPAPAPVVTFHKSQIAADELLTRQLAKTPTYITDLQGAPWSTLYHDYMALQVSEIQKNKEYDNINKIYALHMEPLGTFADLGGSAEALGSGESLVDQIFKQLFSVKTAQAQFGVVVVNPVLPPIAGIVAPIVIGADIPRTAEQILKNFLGFAFTVFATTQVQYWVDYLNKKLGITSLLLYADALGTKYTAEYFKKYIPDDKDGQEVIKKLIPKLSCGLKLVDEKLQPVLKKKTLEYLGYDPNVPLDQQNVDFYQLAGRAGHLLSSKDGQKAYWSSIADVVDKKTDKATTDELTSSGFKSVHTPAGTIKVPTAGVASLTAAKYIEGLNIGGGNATSPAGKAAAVIMASILNNIIITGGAVVSEAISCLLPPKSDPLQSVPTPQAPDQTAPTLTDIEQCLQGPNPDSCFDKFVPPPDIVPQDATTPALQMNKNSYKVGEVPQFQVRNTGAPSAQLIWKIERISGVGGNVVSPGTFKYEDQFTDTEGNWPSSGFEPYNKQFGCEDIGTWRRTVQVGDGGPVFTEDYTVATTPSYNCTGAFESTNLKRFAFMLNGYLLA